MSFTSEKIGCKEKKTTYILKVDAQSYKLLYGPKTVSTLRSGGVLPQDSEVGHKTNHIFCFLIKCHPLMFNMFNKRYRFIPLFVNMFAKQN